MDDLLLAWFQHQRHPLLTPLMLAVTWIHGTLGLLLLVAGFAALLWRRQQRAWLPALLVAVPGAMLLNVALKHLVQRARPVVEAPLLTLDTWSFPSGHAAGSAALYTFAALWLLAQPAARRRRVAVVLTAVGMTLWVCASRVYVGVHYVTDVLAGALIGALWAWAWVAWLRRPRAAGRQEATP